jgi:DEAD/DEAH box helicase domain-containing protein
MLHRAVLPHHDRWAAFLSGLRYVVIDELHSYRGVFGSHVANVLRRLWRVCAFHGSQPRVIACSATISNPRELAATLCARDNFEVIGDCDKVCSKRDGEYYNGCSDGPALFTHVETVRLLAPPKCAAP